MIGKSWHVRQGESHSFGEASFNIGRSGQESFDYDVSPQTFTRLPKGGPKNDNTVGGIVFQNGRAWSENETFLYATFKQS